MSNANIARRSAVEVFFAGKDISQSLRKYLISLTYTDNEEEAADDLQIKLQDRDDVWLTEWLNQAIQSAASASNEELTEDKQETVYKVTSSSGVNVRSRTGQDYYIYGTLAYGSLIHSIGEENGWIKFDYGGKTGYVDSAFLSEEIESSDSQEEGESTSASGETAGKVIKGLKIQSTIVRQNWNGDGKDDYLDCGQFELDSAVCSGPPNVITIKGTALPYNSAIRQTKKSKSWEAYNLKGIAEEMASKSGMSCMYLSTHNPYYQRVEQIEASDISFLQTLCHRAGASLKATNNIIVIFDQAEYEQKDVVKVIQRGRAGGYSKHNLSSGKADVQYTSCRVSYTDPSTGEVIEGIANSKNYDENDPSSQRLEITEKVSDESEAKELAEKYLRLKNKYENTVSFTFPGDPKLLAGLAVTLKGWGPWNGKYIIKSAKHSVSKSGYTTQISLRRALEGS